MTNQQPALPKQAIVLARHNRLMALATAFATVESNNDPRAVGKLGERGLYQFREMRWHELVKEPFDKAFDPKVSTAVFFAHVRLIEEALLRELRVQPTPEMIYAVHCYGFEGFRRRGFDLSKCARTVQKKAAAVNAIYLVENGRN